MTRAAAQPAGAAGARTRLPRLGFLGVGWIGKARLASVAEAGAAEIVGLADPSEIALEEAARCGGERTGAAARVGSLDRLLELGLDGIVIATPSAMHAVEAVTALK